MTARELGRGSWRAKAKMPDKPILLTFDDAMGFATDVLPILQKYHVKATAYIIPFTEDQIYDAVRVSCDIRPGCSFGTTLVLINLILR